MAFKIFFAAVCGITFNVSTFLHAQDVSEEKIPKRPFGPVLKFEPSGMIHRYSKALIGIEYFFTRDLSLQHHFGPVLSVENYNFDYLQYERFRGFAFNNELRYYFFNTSRSDYYRERRILNRTIKSAYCGLELDYNITNIDTNTIYRFNCDSGDCSYYQQKDEELRREWLGYAFIGGAQFIINRRFSLDINGGVGLRNLWITGQSADANAVEAFPGMDIYPTERVVPYPSLSFNLGYNIF